MRKLMLSLLAVSMLFSLCALPACGNSTSQDSSAASPAIEPEPEAEPTKDITVMAEVCEAVSADELLAELIDYDAENDMLVIKKNLSSDQLGDILNLAEPFVEKEAFRIDIGKYPKVIDSAAATESREGFYTQLAEMRCGSVELAAQIREPAELALLGEIPHLTSLIYTKEDTNLTYPAMPALRSLTLVLNRENIVLDGLEASPNLEELTFVADNLKPEFDFPGFTTLTDIKSFADVYTLWELPKLRSVEFKTTTGESLDEFRGQLEETRETEKLGYVPLVTMAVVCDTARTIPSLETLNGKDPASYDPTAGFSDEQKQLFEEYRAAEFAKSMYARVQEGAYIEGPAAVTGPAIVWCVTTKLPVEMPSSPVSTVAGEDYQGMPQSFFTTDPRACAQIVFVYPEHEQAGTYSTSSGVPMGAAYKTHTQVVVVDVANKTVSVPYIAATTDPPATKTTGTPSWGEFLPGDALPYIQSLF